MSNTAILITILTIIIPLISYRDISYGDLYPPPHKGRLIFRNRRDAHNQPNRNHPIDFDYYKITLPNSN